MQINVRNFFNKIFGENEKVKADKYIDVQMLTSYNNQIYNYSNSLYDDETVRSCVDCIAKHFAKMKPTHQLKGKEVNSKINKLLLSRPNEDMSTYDFLYKVVTSLYMQNNAYIYIKWDALGNIEGLYPVLYSQAKLKQDNLNNYYLEFTFARGKRATVSINDLIVLRRNFYENDFFGNDNYTPLYNAVNKMHILDEGLSNTIKNSGIIRGILKLVGMVLDDDLVKKQKNFKDQYYNTQNSGGLVISDETFEYTQLESKPVIADDKNYTIVENKIYNLFGINKNIVIGKYTEDEWQAFYESTLEPLAIQWSQEFTNKLFTSRELEMGNQVIFIADRLAHMNTKSKVDMVTTIKELGVLSKGTIAEIFNLPVPPDKDEILQSLNYINSKIANEYQLDIKKKGGENDKTDGNKNTTSTD